MSEVGYVAERGDFVTRGNVKHLFISRFPERCAKFLKKYQSSSEPVRFKYMTLLVIFCSRGLFFVSAASNPCDNVAKYFERTTGESRHMPN